MDTTSREPGEREPVRHMDTALEFQASHGHNNCSERAECAHIMHDYITGGFTAYTFVRHMDTTSSSRLQAAGEEGDSRGSTTGPRRVPLELPVPAQPAPGHFGEVPMAFFGLNAS